MPQPLRIGGGVLTDAARPIRFRFDERALEGVAGDTLASALLANGERLTGRSFKYHRPRGIVSCGAEEPCALVDVLGAAGREPNQLATLLPLHEGLNAYSQNRWPSLRFDLLSLNDRLSRFCRRVFTTRPSCTRAGRGSSCTSLSSGARPDSGASRGSWPRTPRRQKPCMRTPMYS